MTIFGTYDAIQVLILDFVPYLVLHFGSYTHTCIIPIIAYFHIERVLVSVFFQNSTSLGLFYFNWDGFSS